MTCRLLAVGLVSVFFACSSIGEPTESGDPIPALRSSPASPAIPPASLAPQSASSDGRSFLLPQHRYVKRQGAVERSCPDPYASECVQGYRSLAQLLRPEVSDWQVRDAETLRALRSRREGGVSQESSTLFTSDWLDVGSTEALVLGHAAADITLVAEADDHYVGMSLAGLEDRNGDGYSELLIGAPGWSGSLPDMGIVYLVDLAE